MFTTSIVLNVLLPEFALIKAVPIVSPIFIVDILKLPPSEANNAVDISGSFGSWPTETVKSVKLSQSVFDKVTVTVGVNGIQGLSPVLPPTQLPQLSINAVPLGSPLQSTDRHVIENGKLWISTSPNSELIVVVNVKRPAPGFWKTLLKVIVW